MRIKPSKKNNPDVIDVPVKTLDPTDSIEESDSQVEELLPSDISQDEDQADPEKDTKDAATWETLSTALTPTTTLSRYLAEVRRYPFLSKEEEIQLFQEYQQLGTREAAVKLILANLRVSVKIASEYGMAGLDQMDLIQEGNVGLLQAMKKFDPTRNVRFYAYAAWWVRAFILRHLLNNSWVVPILTNRKLFKRYRNTNARTHHAA